MKVNVFETHDRYLDLMKKQADVVSKGVDDCLKKNPLSLALQDKSPYVYIFGHARTLELDEKMKYFRSGKYATIADVPEKRILWSPRLTKPEAQPNSFLFRAKSKSDIVEICWILPPIELFEQYKKGNITDQEIIRWSIYQYGFNRAELEKSFPDDLDPKIIKMIYTEIREDMQIKSGKFKPVE